MKRLYVAMLLAAVLAVGAMASANASVVGNFGVLSFPNAYSFNNRHDTGETFTDDFKFKVSSSLLAAADIIETEVINFWDITGLTLSIYNLTSGTPVASISGNKSLSILSSALSAGTEYAVRVGGTAAGTAGGMYSGTLAVVPVPVPAALPLMLGALAGLGLIARRKTDA
jgi:hypothetical protein